MSLFGIIMNFNKFVGIFKKSIIIESSAFGHYGKPDDLRRQVLRWVSKKYLHPLKRGVYILDEEYRKINPSLLYAANQLVSPSYVSTEYALQYYGLIPEKVSVITSVTTKKTHKFNNILGRFEYRSINSKLFFGMVQNTEDEQRYFIAKPEKAVLDFFYFTYGAKPDFEYFDSMRFQDLNKINKNKLLEYSQKYNKRVRNIAAAFLKYKGRARRKFRVL